MQALSADGRAAAIWGNKRLATDKDQLSDNEGRLLALVMRIQPTTAYQLVKTYAESPVSNFNASKGKIYPIIERLERLGMLCKRKLEGDRRGTEHLECTARGRKAVKAWVIEIRPTHLLLDDPLRTKVQSFDLLTPQEREDWIVKAKTELHEKLAEVDAYGREVDVPFKEFVHDNAVRSLRARIDWLDMLFLYVKKSDAA